MNVRRRGFAHRLTAMLLAVAMPMCCCVVNGLTGEGCCSDSVAPAQLCMDDSQVPTCPMATASCCNQQQTSSEQPAPCDKAGTCACCIKVPGPIYEWTVPVDSIGTLIIDLAINAEPIADETTAVCTRGSGWNDPPPPWQRVAAGCGHTILHC